MRKKAATIIIFGFIHLLVSTSLLMAEDAAKAGPLPSWNDHSAKHKIMDFVTAVTTEGNPNYVAPAERIATFDNDGTLWCEQPVVQGAFILHRLTKMVEKDPSLKERQPFKAALENDKAYLKTEGMPAILKLFSATHTGMTDEEQAR